MSSGLDTLIFFGQKRQVFNILGQRVELELLDSAADAEVQKNVSGYDIFTREILMEIEILSRAIRSVNGQTFSSEADVRQFVLRLQPPVRGCITTHYRQMRDLQMMEIEEKRRELGELVATPFREDFGEFSKKLPKKKKSNGIKES